MSARGRSLKRCVLNQTLGRDRTPAIMTAARAVTTNKPKSYNVGATLAVACGNANRFYQTIRFYRDKRAFCSAHKKRMIFNVVFLSLGRTHGSAPTVKIKCFFYNTKRGNNGKAARLQRYIPCLTLRGMPLPVWLRMLLLRQMSIWTICFRKAPF